MLIYKEILLCIFLTFIVLASILFLFSLVYWCLSCVIANVRELKENQLEKDNIVYEERTEKMLK